MLLQAEATFYPGAPPGRVKLPVASPSATGTSGRFLRLLIDGTITITCAQFHAPSPRQGRGGGGRLAWSNAARTLEGDRRRPRYRIAPVQIPLRAQQTAPAGL